ncbi:hypothetical protein TrVE_jg13350, partial [Triparma verrucosa]
GTKVEARYRGKAKYYPGKISRVRNNGTYDVAYDDGEKEFGVKREMIKVLESSSRSRSRGRDDSDAGDGIGEGDMVEARYRGKSKWYAGKVARVRSNGTMDIHYDDGEKELGVDPSFVRAVKKSSSRSPRGRRDDSETEGGALEKGTKVEARYRGKAKYYPGKISRVRSNGTYDINYDDGEKEFGVKKEFIKVLESNSRSRSRGRDDSEASDDILEDDKVEARYRGKSKWYPGKVARVRSNGTMDIHYDDGEKELGVDPTFVRRLKSSPSKSKQTYREGTKIEARYRGKSKYYPGYISSSHKDGTYDIEYDDGEFESHVKLEYIKSKGGGMGRSPRDNKGVSFSPDKDDFETVESPRSDNERVNYRTGMKVEARYGGKSKWYGGKITRVRLSGNVDVEYDDGDKEENVRVEMVRVVGGGGGGSEGRRRRGSFANSYDGGRRTGGGSRSPRSPRRRLDSRLSDLD